MQWNKKSTPDVYKYNVNMVIDYIINDYSEYFSLIINPLIPL